MSRFQINPESYTHTPVQDMSLWDIDLFLLTELALWKGSIVLNDTLIAWVEEGGKESERKER